ncbi:MAG: 2-hydroxychromene-2-carboxylate isomerase [Comamonadaceae bacterium]|nr:MAG: 2-hydroxychromene-2-carboxylate isomerase [Comamonadaceae bacterium]
MAHQIDYLFAPQSPWTYLGHARFVQMALAAGAQVRVMPVDLGRVFPVSGGLPLGQRPAQRRAYRLVELKRFSDFLQLPMNIEPKYFPVAADDAARLIIAADLVEGAAAALKLAGAVFSAVWAQQRNIADAGVLGELLSETGLPHALLEQSRAPAAQERYDAYTQDAIERQVFGAPTYFVDGEMFWGQDRLDFVQRKLQS